jgi:hypothetical protein
VDDRDGQEPTIHSDAIPGFTAAQSWALTVVAERAAEAAVSRLLQRDCQLPCPRMAAVETVVFGRAESGVVGLDERIGANERALSRLGESIVWLRRAAIGACITAGAYLAVWAIEELARHAGG